MESDFSVVKWKNDDCRIGANRLLSISHPAHQEVRDTAVDYPLSTSLFLINSDPDYIVSSKPAFG